MTPEQYEAQRQEALAWVEYDRVAEWCAKRGIKGAIGDALPDFTSERTCRLIDEDPEAFEARVRSAAYALACEATERRLRQAPEVRQ